MFFSFPFFDLIGINVCYFTPHINAYPSKRVIRAISGALPLIEVAAAMDFAAADEILVAACGGKASLEAAFHASCQHFYHRSVVLLSVVFCHVFCVVLTLKLWRIPTPN